MKKVYLLAAVMAIITAFSIYRFGVYLEDKSLPENVERTSVVVAATALEKGTILTEDMLRVVQLPKEAVMNDTAHSVTELIGCILTQAYVPNEQILRSQTAAQGDKNRDRLSLELKEGECAVTVDVSVITGTAGYIREGDTVTLTAVNTNADGTKDIAVLYQHVPVIRVSTSATRDSQEYNTLTLVLPEKDTYAFMKYQEMGIIRPVLESAFEAAAAEEKG